MATNTTLYICPVHKGGCEDAVKVDFGKFSDTTVTVEACSQMRETGAVSYELNKSAAMEILEVDHLLIHAEGGLVAFHNALDMLADEDFDGRQYNRNGYEVTP